MPKSYTLDERGSHEGARHDFDPYRQTMARLQSYWAAGHPCEKIELLVLGGTWSSYPEGYQRWFVLRCFEALNDFRAQRSGVEHATAINNPSRIGVSDPHPDARGRYNLLVRDERRTARSFDAHWALLEAAQEQNETALARCVGLVFETRPDHICSQELQTLRRLGATKIQLGVQSIRDTVLLANQRGHDSSATRRAFALLRQAGFKILIHWMPNLLGSTAQEDMNEYEALFDDEDFRPDEVKIYPCVLDPSAELVTAYEEGRWRPYTGDELDTLLLDALQKTPRYCRIARIMRDLPTHAGASQRGRASRRHELQDKLQMSGEILQDIRARELGARCPSGALKLVITEYGVSRGEEVFMEWVDESDHIAGFARLFLPHEDAMPCCAELEGSALLRELHIYGHASRLGHRDNRSAQHRGLGRLLIEEVCKRAAAGGYRRLSVISAVGTREYYRRRGFADGRLYQHRALGRKLAKPV